MADPNIDILADLTITVDGSNILSFLNAATREWFDMEVPVGVNYYFWFDNMHIGFLSNSLEIMYLVDLSNGEVSSFPVSQSATRLLAPPDFFSALEIKQDPLSLNDFIFDYIVTWLSPSISNDTRYLAERDRSQEEDQVIVTDFYTGEIVWESNPSDDYFDNVISWSPVNASYLAIVQGKIDQNIGFPAKDTTLVVVDIKTGEIIASQKGDIGRVVWSPDGTSILYENALHLYANFGYNFTSAPCIFNIITGENECIWNIPNSYIPTGPKLLTTADYQWSSDSLSIYFISYFGSLGYRGKSAGNICIYYLINGTIYCPTENLAELPGWNNDWLLWWNEYSWSIQSYDFSPDNSFIHFCVSSNSILSDDQTGPSQDGIIDFEGTKVTLWAGQIYDDVERCSWGGTWRPLP